MKVQQMHPKVHPSQHHPATNGQTMLVPRKVIEHYSYNMTEMIGKGYSSQVFKGKDDRNGDLVAVKVIDMKMIKNEVQKFLLSNEISIIKKLNNYNLLDTKDVFQTQNNTYIITELCNHGDLKELLTKYNKLSESAALKILRHIINGMKELFGSDIIHRDLKPANVLLKDGVPKIADFGFSQDLKAPPCKFYYNVGTPMYMCPQALKNNQYSHKSDIWSLGVLYYELLYGITPWNANTEQELAQKITSIPVTFPANVEVSELSKDFIRRCVLVDENKRLGPQELDKHPLIQQSVQKDKQKQKELQQKLQQQQQQQQQQENPISRPTQQRSQPQATSTPAPNIEQKQNVPLYTQQKTSSSNEDNNNIQNKQYPSTSSYQQSSSSQQQQLPPSYGANNNSSSSNNQQIQKELGKENHYQYYQQKAQVTPKSQQNTQSSQQQQQNFTSYQNGNNNDNQPNFKKYSQDTSNPYYQSEQQKQQQQEGGQQQYQNSKPVTSSYNNQQNNGQNMEVLQPSSNNYENQQNNNYLKNLQYRQNYDNQYQEPQQQQQNQANPLAERPLESGGASQLSTNATQNSNSNQSSTTNYQNEEFMQNDMIILAQINFCRFLVRLQKLTEEFSNLETPYLKERIIFFILKNVMCKITKLKEMCDKKQNLFYLSSFPQYIQNESFKKFIIVINEYYTKYQQLFNNYDERVFQAREIKIEMQADKKFETIFDRAFYDTESFYTTLQTFLRFSIHEMNHVIKENLKEEADQVPNKVEGSIVLLDYLVTYFQLAQLILDKFTDFAFFAQASKIEQIAEGRPVRLTKSHFAQIRNKIYSLEI